MEPAHGRTATIEVELGPVCERCLRYLPHAHLTANCPTLVCEDCQKGTL